MSNNHLYGLDWLDQDQLFDITKKTFSKALSKKEKTTPPDPFTLVAQAVVTNTTLSKTEQFEGERKINKTLSNNVGLWHQHVLGLASNWIDLGSSGGGIDLKTIANFVQPEYNKPIYAEVKNRFNTIKSSDECMLWDRLNEIVKTNGAITYVFQIVPKTKEQYDRPWNVSGRLPRKEVRCCDGVTAYEMVFGRKDALKEIYTALPLIFSDIQQCQVNIDASDLESLFYTSFPE